MRVFALQASLITVRLEGLRKLHVCDGTIPGDATSFPANSRATFQKGDFPAYGPFSLARAYGIFPLQSTSSLNHCAPFALGDRIIPFVHTVMVRVRMGYVTPSHLFFFIPSG